MVATQLVERSLAIPEARGSNPVIGKIYIEHLFIVNCIVKTKINKKEAGNGSFLKKRGRKGVGKNNQRTDIQTNRNATYHHLA